MTSHPYGPSFWWTYAANLSLMVTVSLLFRYADFVTLLGGSETQLGVITGLGMVGAVGGRCFQGVGIDRYGPVRIWILSLVLLVCCLVAHLAVRSLHPPLIHLLRISYMVGLAGAFGASITYVSLRSPPERMAEMIGMLGSSGFVGMAVGPLWGDWLFHNAGSSHLAVQRMFLCAAAAAANSLLCAWLATRGEVSPAWRQHVEVSRPEDETGNPLFLMGRLVRRYHPGMTLLVGVAMGIGIGMPGTFLRTFAARRDFPSLGYYFFTYAVVAFIVRVATRRLADRWGNRPTILLGLTSLAAAMAALPMVTTEVSLIVPGSCCGLAHAFLFPATVAEGSQAFPVHYRGLATTLILTMFDVGSLVGQPLFGFTVELARAGGWDGYRVAFFSLAGLILAVAVIYAIRKPRPVATRDALARTS